MLKTQKHQWVKDTKELLASVPLAYVIRYKGLKAKQLYALRQAIKEHGKVCFAKNSLAKIAVKDTGHEGMTDLFKEVSLLVAVNDPIAGVKCVLPFLKEHKAKLEIAGGVWEGKLLDKVSVEELGKIPSREEQLSQLAFLLEYPLINLADTLKRAGEAKA